MFKTYIPKPYIPELGAYHSKNYKILEEFLTLNVGTAEYVPENDKRSPYVIRECLMRTSSCNGFPVFIICREGRIFCIREDLGEDD